VNPFALCQRASAGVASRWRNAYYRLRGLRLLGYVNLRAVEIPLNHRDIELGAGVALDRGVVLLCPGPAAGRVRLRLGARCYVNRNTMFDAAEELTVGADCAIGPGCYLTDHDHGFDPNLPPLALPLVAKPTRLGDRVWIGANVTVLKGVTVGDGSVIGAGSVVTRDIPPGCVAVGNPARVVRTPTGGPPGA
jgi:acetyltransferase-like isoleucine patch superfamily enzyme